MMRSSVCLLGSMGLLLGLTGCPDQVTGNPFVLWLGPLGPGETRVQLVEVEPRPF